VLTKKADIIPVRMPYLGTAHDRPVHSAGSVAANPDYGRIACHCEGVSVGEIIDATISPVPAKSLDGLRRRTRCMQGRCQGFNCLANITEILALASRREPEAILGLK
jgi:glycerol-3-phosphate dehydrogenase